MVDIILDTLLDGAKLLPFLFVTYLLMEWLEHRTGEATQNMIRKAGKTGPLIGGILGAAPQCGFSAAASGLYAGGVISLGTLFAIYLSTSDEMLPIMLSEKVDPMLILSIIGGKVIIGVIVGFAIDLLLVKKHDEHEHIHDLCEHDHCHCEGSILKSAVIHTIQILAFILVISFAINILMEYVGADALGNLVLNKKIIGPVIAALIGLIPNCGASVAITELYLEGVMTAGSMMAGLLTGAGIGIMVLMRTNRNVKRNACIIGGLYFVGTIAGIVIDLFV